MTPIYVLCAILLIVGIYGVVVKKNLIKIIIGISLMVQAVALFLLSLGYAEGVSEGLFQTVGLIALIGGLAVMSLMIVTAVRLYEKYGTFDISEIRRLRG
jgi:Multisubunit Na+/H+ antiporter, MnhC subunit